MSYMKQIIAKFVSIRSWAEGIEPPLDGRIHLSVNASFSLHSGDMKVNCRVHLDTGSATAYKDYIVEAADFENAFTEALRRLEADRRLSPLCLPRVGDAPAEPAEPAEMEF